VKEITQKRFSEDLSDFIIVHMAVSDFLPSVDDCGRNSYQQQYYNVVDTVQARRQRTI